MDQFDKEVKNIIYIETNILYIYYHVYGHAYYDLGTFILTYPFYHKHVTAHKHLHDLAIYNLTRATRLHGHKLKRPNRYTCTHKLNYAAIKSKY